MAFTFDRCKLSIAGNTFEIDTGDEKIIKAMQKCAEISSTQRIKDDDNVGDAIKKIVSLCHETLDSVLGAGAFEKIFHDRQVNWDDCVDVMCYVSDEIVKYKQDKIASYGTYAGNHLKN